jgi:hypothetical protein
MDPTRGFSRSACHVFRSSGLRGSWRFGCWACARGLSQTRLLNQHQLAFRSKLIRIFTTQNYAEVTLLALFPADAMEQKESGWTRSSTDCKLLRLSFIICPLPDKGQIKAKCRRGEGVSKAGEGKPRA